MVFELLEKVPAKAETLIEREVARLTDWLGDVRVTARFPTPLSTRLASRAREGGGSMSTSNVELVAGFYRSAAEGDFDTVLAMLDPDVTVWQTEELPWGGSYEGIDGFIEFFGKLRESIESKVDIEEVFEAGEHVVQMGHTRGTVNANGVAFDVREVHVWGVRDGKLLSLRSHIDTPAMLAALHKEG